MKNLFIDCRMGAAGDMLTAAILELFPDKEDKIKELNNLSIPKVKFELEDSFKCGIKGSHLSVKVDGEEELVEDYISHEHSHRHCHEHIHAHLEDGEEYLHSHEHSHEHCHEHFHSHDHIDHDHDHCCHDHEDHNHEHCCHDHGDHAHDHEHDHCCHDHEGHDHNHEHFHSHHHDHAHGHTHSHHHSHRGMKEIEEIVNNIKVSDKVKKDIMSVYKEIAEAESISHNVDVTEIHFHEVGAMDAIADITAFCYLLDLLEVDKIIASPIHVGSGHVHCAHGILPVPAPATAYILRDLPIYGGQIEGELCTPTGAAILKYFVNDFGNMPTMKVNKIGYGMGKKDFEVANCIRVFLGEGENLDEIVYELSCNVDDMTGEEISFAMDKLFEAGAAEVYTIAVGMKKNRPGNLIRVMCKENKKQDIINTIFKHTTTIGIREVATKRYILKREIEELTTSLGKVHRKKSIGYGSERNKYEYDDISKLANEENKSLYEIRKLLDKELS